MSSSIYNISAWIGSNQYFKNDIITINSLYYYATQDHLSSSNFNNDLNSGMWVGYINFNGIQKPYFTWKSSYKYTNDSVPRVRKIQFGDGYTQRASDGINNILMNINFPFENIQKPEYTAILHFLESRKGVESFVFVPPAPYDIQKLFICEKWSTIQNYFDNYTINAVFIETVV